MKDLGFFRTAAATPSVKVADVKANLQYIQALTKKAAENEVSLLVFPELCITGYSCADLFAQSLLVDEAEKAVAALAGDSSGYKTASIVGAPVRIAGRLYNCAIVLKDGKIHGIVPKVYLPNYNEFYEARWFSSGEDFSGGRRFISYAGFEVEVSPRQIFKLGNTSFAIEICEDLWVPIPPSSYHALAGAEIIANLSASNEVLMKHNYRKALTENQSARTISGYVYSSCGFGESTQDLVYAGSSLICENGSLLAENPRFSTDSGLIISDIDTEKIRILRQKENTFRSVSPDGRTSGYYASLYSVHDLGECAPTDFSQKFYRHVEPHPFVPDGDGGEIRRRAEEIVSIQTMGLATRLQHIRCRTAVLGISGGLDSTLALIITVLAFDKLGWPRERIIGVTMPGFGTSDRTHCNAVDLMGALGVSSKEISIAPAVLQHFKDIGQNPDTKDVTYENSQARERTQLLMDIANKEGGIVIGTGDLSELALGWATYNGDHMSMYAVNASIPKTLVIYLVKWAAAAYFKEEAEDGRSVRDILLDIVATPISPELTPADKDGNIAQKTEDLVGPYELHDFFLYYSFRFGYSPSKMRFLAEKAFVEKGVYTKECVNKWLKVFYRRFFNQQFKRSCLPDCPKVGSVSLSPRGDWRMPSDASSALWLDDLN